MIDLHTHSLVSDGTDTPAELVAHGEHAALNHHLIQTIDVDGVQALKGYTGGSISTPVILDEADAREIGDLVDRLLVGAGPLIPRASEVSVRVLNLVAAGRGDLLPWADIDSITPEQLDGSLERLSEAAGN